jgi:cobalamin biosynthesis Mg chelatase CobN
VTECDPAGSYAYPFENGDSYLANFTLAGDPVVGFNERLYVDVLEQPDTNDTAGTETETTPDETPTRTEVPVTTTAGGDTTPAETTRERNSTETETTSDARSSETATPPPGTGTGSVSTTTGTGPGFAAVSAILAFVCCTLWLFARRSGRD